MKTYKPTKEEINALFEIAPFLNDAISINENYLNDKETTKQQKKIIVENVKNIYKAVLEISENLYNLPFC